MGVSPCGFKYYLRHFAYPAVPLGGQAQAVVICPAGVGMGNSVQEQHVVDMLIKNCHVLDGRGPSGYVKNQDILIQGTTIKRVGAADSATVANRVIDGRNMLAVPGLINAHTHSPENVLRGTSERLPLELWAIKQFAFRPIFPPRLVYLATLAGAAEMLRSGTTAVLDHFWMAGTLTSDALDAVMQAYSDSGMRVCLAPMLEDCDLIFDAMLAANPRLAPLWEGQPARLDSSALLDLVQDCVECWHGRKGGRLRCMPGPCGPIWCTKVLLSGCYDVAQRFGTGLHMHLAETRVQAQVYRRAYGHSAVIEMDRLGLLGPDTSLAHCVWVSEDELDTLARTKARVVHNPVSNLKLGSGIAPVPAMRSHGIEVALGTDGAASNDNQNMFAVMKLAGLLHSPVTTHSAHWLSAREVFEMATVAGAIVLGHEGNLGRIRDGYLADIVLLDLSQAYQDPLSDAVVHLIYCETGMSVRHVIVNGQLVVENGRVLTIQVDEIHRELVERMRYYNASSPQPTERLHDLMDECAKALSQMTSEEARHDG